MPLNYSKWDMLELSDDSDIEEHPNVDKKSMIRWKQRDIHEKREARRLRIAKLHTELELNAVLRPRIQAVLTGTSEKGVDHYRAVQRRIKEQPSDEKPATGAPNQPTYDQMLGQLLEDVLREGAWMAEGASVNAKGEVVKDGKKVDHTSGEPDWLSGAVPDSKEAKLKEALVARLEWHLKDLAKRDTEAKKEIEEEEKESKKRITSEDIHEGWSKSSVAKAQPGPLDDVSKPKGKGKAKQTETTETIEVLNPGAVASSSKAATAEEVETDEDMPDLGPLTPAAQAFAAIPVGDYERAYAFIQKDSSVLTSRTQDSLLAEAFDAERRGEKSLAQRCVHQSLLIQYCRQLGKDGVGLFFQRMIARNPKSIDMFVQDYQRTYTRVAQRTAEILAEEAANPQEREQIQLVAEDPSLVISFNLPDGPPPAELKIEGDGAETLDMEEVRAFLQRKWEIFEAFPEKLKIALRTESLDEVNKVLGAMKVAEAEEVVERMQEGGMLSFSESGVRDMTGAGASA